MIKMKFLKVTSCVLLSGLITCVVHAQETLQTVTDRGNSTTNSLKVSSFVDVGDSYDPTHYGMLQITRPSNQGSAYHLSFIRNGSMVYGMGYLNNSNTFGLQPGGNNFTSEGFFMLPNGNVGIGSQSPAHKFDVAGGHIRVSGNLLVSTDNLTGGGIKLADDGDIVDLNDGWATHRFSYGLRLTNANSGGNSVIQLANGMNGYTYFNAGNVGINTTSPVSALEVSGGMVIGGANLDRNGSLGNLSYLNGTGKTLIGNNRSGGRGETSFISNQSGGSSGGFTFYNHNNEGVENELLTLNANGQVGIGTISPTSTLDVRGVISVPEIAFRNADGGDDSDPYRLRKVRQAPNENWLELQLNDDHNESFRIYGNSCVGYGCGAYSGNLYHSFDASGNVYHSGYVGIGTNNPTEKLTVNGKIKAREIRVDANGLPDYVFEPGYKNTSLADLEKYIQTNKHLPEIPSAQEAEKNGLELGEMNKLLLKKIEELTLHLIDQEKMIRQQQADINALKKDTGTKNIKVKTE